MNNLPPEASARLSRLVIVVDTLASAAAYATNRIHSINHALGMNPGSPDKPALELELDELRKSQADNQKRHRSAAALQQSCASWVRHWQAASHPPRPLELIKSFNAKPKKGETLVNAIERVRSEIVELKREQYKVSLARLSNESVKQTVPRFVEHLAKSVRVGLEVNMHGLTNVSFDWPGMTMVSGITPTAIMAMMAWLDPDRLIKRLEDASDILPVNPNTPTMTIEAKENRLDEIASEIYERELDEELWVSMCHESGMIHVTRRHDASPMVVLGVQFAVRKTKANGIHKPQSRVRLKQQAPLDTDDGDDAVLTN